jgi:hypothetical protein
MHFHNVRVINLPQNVDLIKKHRVVVNPIFVYAFHSEVIQIFQLFNKLHGRKAAFTDRVPNSVVRK